MNQRTPAVDAYIAKAAPFARPILEHLRALVHRACPQVEESIKWSMPFFTLGAPLCHMAAFKQHCAFGFWKHRDVFGDDPVDEAALGQFGRLTSLADLPDDAVLLARIRQAAQRNVVLAAAPKKPKATQPNKPPPEPPEDLRQALARNAAAQRTFDGFSATNRREYIDWLTEAKTTATREKRLRQAIEWMAEGKIRNWKYVRA